MQLNWYIIDFNNHTLSIVSIVLDGCLQIVQIISNDYEVEEPPLSKGGDRYAGNKQFQTLCLDHLLQVTCRHVSKQTKRRSEVANLVSCGPTLYINVYLYIPSYPTIFP